MTATASIRVSSLPGEPRIDRRIYGHFLESAFFANIEGGVLDEGSDLAVAGPGALAGCRRDVIEAFRELGLPVVRWPGGNFTSAYWWQDGIGPRDERPRRLELAWGSEESNRFGTPEFLAWCEAVGATPYLAHSARQVDDAVRWVEYTNYGGETEMTAKRAADGHPEPYGVPIWGLGNEVYGDWQMGHRPVSQYVADALEHARFMRAVDPGISFVAVGDQDREWTREVVATLGRVVDWISLHLYGASRHLVDPSEAEFDDVVAQSVFFEQEIAAQAEVIEDAKVAHGITRPLAIALDEWNIRHLEPRAWPEPVASADGAFEPRPDAEPVPEDFDVEGRPGKVRVNRYSPRTLADALFHAGVFHAMHRTAHRSVPVGMANTVNLVNANGVLVVRPDGVVRATTFHVWDLYQNHTGPVPLDAQVVAPSRSARVRHGDQRDAGSGYRTTPATVPLLDVSASASEDGHIVYVTAINRSSREDITASLEIDGEVLPAQATVRRIGAGVADLFAVNTISAPDTVMLSGPETVSLSEGVHTFPAHSISVLEIRVRMDR